MFSIQFRKWLIALMIGWLPLSGAIASTMPIYATVLNGNAESVTLPANDVTLAMPCHQTAADEDTADTACSHCTLCHIAGATIPPTFVSTHATPHHDCPQSISTDTFVSFIPDLLPRPPSLSRA